MKSILVCIGVLTFIFFSSWTFADEPNHDIKYLVRSKAFDVRSFTLEGPGVIQTSYKIKLRYPAKAIGEGEMRKLRKMGWKPCAQKHVDWENFIDDTVSPSRDVYQTMDFFLRKDRMLVVSMRYEQKDAGGNNIPPVPAGDIQKVFIIDYDLSVPSVLSASHDDLLACGG